MRQVRRFLRAILVLTCVALLVAPAVAYVLIVHPSRATVSAADPVDAVVALGGWPESGQAAAALVADGAATTLVISYPYDATTVPALRRRCAEATRGPAIEGAPATLCFRPDPMTTRGEARAIRRLAQANGWDEIAVVAPRYHLSRARFIIGRCFPGELRMVEADVPMTPQRWRYEYAYQSAAFGKAALQWGC